MRHQTLSSKAILIAALSFSLPLHVRFAGEAHAQAPESSEDRAAALGREGLSLFDQGRWLEASVKFQEAQKLARSPVFDLYTARSLRNAGRLIEAETVFRRVVDGELSSKAPEAFAKAKADAKREHAQLVERIPKIRIRPTRALASGGELSLDGVAVSAAAAVATDPGKHTVVVREQGKEIARKEIDVRDGGGTLDVSVEVPAVSSGATSAASNAAATPSQPPPVGAGAAEEGSLLPGALVLGAGVASLIAGAVTGGLAMSEKSDLEATCPAGRCPESARDTLDEATRLATASTATFIIGGVLAAGGITLLILRPGGGDPGVKSAIHLDASPGGLSLSGRF